MLNYWDMFICRSMINSIWLPNPKNIIDNLLNEKANQATTYTKIEADNLLNNKANQSTTYTKTETDNLLITK